MTPAVRRKLAAHLRTIAANVRQARSAAGWSQAELARRARIDVTTVSAIERAQANPTVETMAKLARALRLDVLDLVI